MKSVRLFLLHTLRAAAIAVAVVSVAVACNIPVFRYALERWVADRCDVIVFHRGPLTDNEAAAVDTIDTSSHSNCVVVKHDITSSGAPELESLWKLLSGRPGVTLPHVVVRERHGRDGVVNLWSGPLSRTAAAGLLGSPARDEIVRRLQSGDAIVWLVVASSDPQRTRDAVSLVRTQCAALPSQVMLPEGIGLPGSELYSEVPLLLQFSVLEIRHDDPDEQFLVRQLTGFRADAFKAGEPLIVPVFGRGRALEVIPYGELNADLMLELTRFLCGACSCQVKEQNPGFDLLLTTDWNLALFGEDAELPPPATSVGSGQQAQPELIPIPKGTKRP